MEIEGSDGRQGALTARAALQSARRLESAAQEASRKARAGWRLRASGETQD